MQHVLSPDETFFITTLLYILMRKTYALFLPLAMAGSLAVNATVDFGAKRFPTVKGAAPMHLASGLLNKATQSMAFGDVRSGSMITAPKAAEGPALSQQAESFGYIGGPDGSYWTYTETVEARGYYYGGATFKVYDDKHALAGTVKVSVPSSMSVNRIVMFGDVTSKLFDNDANSQEVLVELHAVGDASNNYNDSYITQVYRLDGTLVREYSGSGMLVDEQVNSWTKYQRFILSYADEENGEYVNRFDVIKGPSYWDSIPQVEHSFAVDPELIVMSDLGAPINVYFIDGKAYYTISHYAKPYVEGVDSTTYDQIYAKDNRYVVKSYDQNYRLCDSIAVPLHCPANAMVRMASFGAMSSDDLSKNYFTSDGNLGYVVTFYDYSLSTDDYSYSFVVYDSKGDSVNTVCDNVVNTYQYLADVKGFESQVLFMQSIDGVEQVQMVDVPSCTKQTTFPAMLNGEQISTDINRYPKGDTYQYVMKLGTGDADADNNLIARLGWYNRDLTLDHYTSFNLGPNGQLFTPNLSESALNPYLFNTNDSLEFIYIAKIKREGSTVIDEFLRVADGQGNVIKEWGPDDAKGKLYSANLMTFDELNKELVVVYLNEDNGLYTLDYYPLPFSKFEKGGDGTAENPYLVATAGDMALIANEPNASYKLANDIDMDYANKDWTPISSFGGTLDGAGHSISNLSIESSSSNVGLFSSLAQNARIKDLSFVNPTIDLTSNNQYVGVLAAQAVSDTISNVHVFGAKIDAPSGSATTGGLVGRSTLYSLIEGCSFEGDIDLPSASSVGGIAGELMTSAKVEASSVSGKFNASTTLGGIVGSIGSNGSAVNNCRADVDLHAKYTVGGIVGDNDSRGAVANNIAKGTILADAPRWGGLSAAGIIGSLGSDWSHKDTVIVKNNVSAVSISTNEENANDTVAHAIVGWSIANEQYEAGEKHYTDAGLANNYVVDTVTVLGKAVASTDDKSVEGAKIAADDLNKAFFTGIGYAFGNSVAEPWKGENGLPVLFFNDTPLALVLSSYSASIAEGGEAELTAAVYGATSDAIDVTSSDAAVADAEITPLDNGEATIKIIAHKAGVATITIEAGTLKAECIVTVSSTTGIDNATVAEGLAIKFNGESIVTNGASSISVVALDGKTAAKANGNAIGASRLGKGVYVVVATGADGKKTSSKIVIK